ncbi:hypothetical protein HDC95_000329 [Microbacterium sp. AK031]|nr:hypothetical protein [Microbacterium sp. AK031]
MSPITPPTLTRLDPAYPLLWRDVDTVQFGLEDVVRIPVSEPWVDRLLQSLRDGFRPSAFDVIAHGAGAPRDAARELLSALKPVLRTDEPPLPRIWIESLNMVDSRIAARTEIALVDEGFRTADRGTPQAVAVVLVEGAASARQLSNHLRDDVAHLPIAFEVGGTTVGPLVVPGRTPCLACRDGHERERDPAWPMLHAQLVGAASGHITAARTAEAAALAARILAEPGRMSRSVRISPDGRRVWRSLRFHAECRCREQSFRSPEGSETAAAPLSLPHETTTGTAYERRA